MHTSYIGKQFFELRKKKMYRVPNDISHLQFLEYLSTHLMTYKNRKVQQSINKSAVSEAYGNKR